MKLIKTSQLDPFNGNFHEVSNAKVYFWRYFKAQNLVLIVSQCLQKLFDLIRLS